MINKILEWSIIDSDYNNKTSTLVLDDQEIYIYCKFFETSQTFNCNIDTNIKIDEKLIKNVCFDFLELTYCENIPLKLFKESPKYYKKNIERLKNNIKNYQNNKLCQSN